MQFELEQAHHANCQSWAAHQRIVAEAEQLGADGTPSVPFLRAVAARLRWPLIREPLTRETA